MAEARNDTLTDSNCVYVMMMDEGLSRRHDGSQDHRCVRW